METEEERRAAEAASDRRDERSDVHAMDVDSHRGVLAGPPPSQLLDGRPETSAGPSRPPASPSHPPAGPSHSPAGPSQPSAGPSHPPADPPQPPADDDDDEILCVICLGAIRTRPTAAMPCGHDRFHFWCINEWVMHHNAFCPLCKGRVTSLHCFLHNADPWVLSVPDQARRAPAGLDALLNLPPRHHRGPRLASSSTSAAALERRAYIYQHGLYALHVGANRYSGYYAELTPQMFAEDPDLVSRARAFLRRELAVLVPAEAAEAAGNNEGQGGLGGGNIAAANEADLLHARSRLSLQQYLVEYVTSLLLTMDTQGSTGQAEELLREHIGLDRARHLLHELRSWLRSPFRTLESWDRRVQYDEPGQRDRGENRARDRSDRSDRSHRSYRNDRDDRDDRDDRYDRESRYDRYNRYDRYERRERYDHYEPMDHYEPGEQRDPPPRQHRRRRSSA